MKRFKSEFAHSYKTYSFGYCEYAECEKSDSLSHIYALGFLPYTGMRGIQNTLYMARSARVRLEEFVPTSENRRIFKKFDGTLKRTITPLTQFDIDATFTQFCLEYFAKRHGNVMPKERFETILNAGFITDVATYAKGGTIVGYVLLAQDNKCSHYWFSFYDLVLVQQSLGMWLLLDCARMAKEEGKKDYYVGTVYGEKGLYKTNFPALEFWDGNNWNADVDQLRTLCRRDNARTCDIQDRWKDEKDDLLFTQKSSH